MSALRLEVICCGTRQSPRHYLDSGVCAGRWHRQLAIGISAGLLIVTSWADTVLLFGGRACFMSAFAVLGVYLLWAGSLAEDPNQESNAYAGRWR